MIRLFTALEIPDEVAACLQPVQRGLSGARWVARENLHITLRFIGAVDERMAEVATQLSHMEDATHASFRVGLFVWNGQ